MYPTKDEILNTQIEFVTGTFPAVAQWKETDWRNARRIQGDMAVLARLASIKSLLLMLAELHIEHMEPVTIYTSEVPVMTSMSSSFSTRDRQIILTQPSIITGLHEFGHALHGASELLACAWSIHLFKMCFPIAYNNLEWQGHMLVQPASNSNNRAGATLRQAASNE